MIPYATYLKLNQHTHAVSTHIVCVSLASIFRTNEYTFTYTRTQTQLFIHGCLHVCLCVQKKLYLCSHTFRHGERHVSDFFFFIQNQTRSARSFDHVIGQDLGNEIPYFIMVM